MADAPPPPLVRDPSPPLAAPRPFLPPLPLHEVFMN
jgi:hypothetical protein